MTLQTVDAVIAPGCLYRAAGLFCIESPAAPNEQMVNPTSCSICHELMYPLTYWRAAPKSLVRRHNLGGC